MRFISASDGFSPFWIVPYQRVLIEVVIVSNLGSIEDSIAHFSSSRTGSRVHQCRSWNLRSNLPLLREVFSMPPLVFE